MCYTEKTMITEQSRIIEFQLEEARWIDSVISPLLPQWLARGVKKRAGTFIGRMMHFFVDYFMIAPLDEDHESSALGEWR